MSMATDLQAATQVRDRRLRPDLVNESMTAPRAIRRKPFSVPPPAKPTTIADRLIAEAKAAGGQDHADQRDPGEMSR